VPTAVGMAQTDATTLIAGLGLVAGPITFLTLTSDTVPAGQVLAQNPAAGTPVFWGSVVGLVVSIGALAPGAAFDDIPPSATYFDAANLMFGAGVATGCIQSSAPKGRSFCPGSYVTRQEMAAFFVRAVTGTIALAIFNPTPYFMDVPASNPFFPHIQKMKELGITAGCGEDEFCPTDTILRWEMAILMVRARPALYGASFTFNSTPYFADAPIDLEFTGMPFPFIQRSYEEDITKGCGANPLIFCPGPLVTRGQMASFIMRGLFNETTILGPSVPQVTRVSPTMAVTAGTQITVTIAGANTNFQPEIQ
jgi:hypothetical protein